jgi:hypothetical protein
MIRAGQTVMVRLLGKLAPAQVVRGDLFAGTFWVLSADVCARRLRCKLKDEGKTWKRS